MEASAVRLSAPGAHPKNANEQVARLLGPLLRMPGALRDGGVYILGIEKFRLKLGDNWTRYRGRIYEAVENTIADVIDAKDVFIRAGEHNYVVSFADADKTHSAAKAGIIALKIKEKLFGQSNIEADLAMLGEEAMNAARARAAEAAQQAAKDARSQKRLADCDFIYLPLWDAKNKVLSTYVCLPALRQRSGRIQTGADILPPETSDIEWAEFNTRTLDYARDVAEELYRNQFAVFSSVHCQYQSMGTARSREIVLGACRRIPDYLRKFLQIHIVGADGSVPASTLAERVSALKPYFRLASLQLQSLDQAISRLAFAGLHHVTYRLDPGAQNFEKIATLVREARNARLATSIAGIPDLATADKIASLGVAYLSGPFMGEALEMPANMMRCTLEELGRRKGI